MSETTSPERNFLRQMLEAEVKIIDWLSFIFVMKDGRNTTFFIVLFTLRFVSKRQENMQTCYAEKVTRIAMKCPIFVDRLKWPVFRFYPVHGTTAVLKDAVEKKELFWSLLLHGKSCQILLTVPIGSMYGIFTYIYHNQLNVGKYPYMDPMGYCSCSTYSAHVDVVSA